MYNQTNLGSRHCFRCDKQLTDAASLNEGIGPICRMLDNAILARLIPSDMGKVLAAYSKVDVLGLVPETLDTFMKLEAAFRASDAGTREDWRAEVKRIEWILSYGQSYSNIQTFKAIVLALGYVGLIALWNGEAATGEAFVFPFDGRLYLQGPQNKGARWALKKIQGWQFHPSFAGKVAKACWSFPADQFDAFRMTVATNYPNFFGMTEAVNAAKEFTALKEAEQAAVAPLIEAAPIAPPTKVAIISIIEVGDVLKVSAPFRTSYIAELRQTSKADLPRKWLADEKVWEFPVAFKEQVKALVTKHYGYC